MAGGSRKLPNLAEGRIPGYSGYIPSMKNHLVGNRYSESTRRAKECTDLIKAGYNPSGEKRLVDMRPQGREYLYAQVAPMSGAPRYQYDPRVCFYRVQKRRAPRYMTKFLGIVDVPSMNTVVGGPGTGPVQLLQMKSASLPEQSFKDRSIQTRRIFPEELPEVALDTRGQVPGYTGHQHAGQHLFAKSYGSTTRQLVVDVPDGDTIKKSKRFLYFRDARPIGDILTEKHRIPGYQGYIPAKNNHIYGKTYGRATDLAPIAEETMKQKFSASALTELVENPPQGGVDLYAQSMEMLEMPDPKPLHVRVSKGRFKGKYVVMCEDYKLREPTHEVMDMVVQARHQLTGYTGHIHGAQHVFAESYGHKTRRLREHPKDYTSDSLIDFADDRPNARPYEVPPLLHYEQDEPQVYHFRDPDEDH